jgi:hypothetical protein
MDTALHPLFGDNLPAYYTEVERHQAEARELIGRHRRVTQELVDAALDRLTFFGGERRAFLGAALENTLAQREAVDKELHEALVAAKARFIQRVKALQVDQEEERTEENPPDDWDAVRGKSSCP